MFILKIISLVTHIITCAVPVFLIVNLLLSLIFSLIKKSLHVSIFNLIFFVLFLMLLPVLFIKGFAFVSYFQEKRFSYKIHALASFMIAAIFLIQMMRKFTNFVSTEWQLSLILTFIITGILLWKEIPDKVLRALGGEVHDNNKL
jgi:hypothetical protein